VFEILQVYIKVVLISAWHMNNTGYEQLLLQQFNLIDVLKLRFHPNDPCCNHTGII
jgi:hypothetical protein